MEKDTEEVIGRLDPKTKKCNYCHKWFDKTNNYYTFVCNKCGDEYHRIYDQECQFHERLRRRSN